MQQPFTFPIMTESKESAKGKSPLAVAVFLMVLRYEPALNTKAEAVLKALLLANASTSNIKILNL